MANSGKVRFNLKNVHYAVLDESGDTPSWDTPVAIPGAVSLTLDPSGDSNNFYADGIVYYKTVANNGYEGDLEVAKFPDSMLKEVWGMKEDETAKVLIESAEAEPKPFALLYQIDGDVGNELYLLYRCTGTRPGIGSTTNTETKEPQTQSITISAMPLIASLDDPMNMTIKASTTPDTPATVKNGWFKSVWKKTAAPANE